jgi:hypothetical protein
MMTKRIAALAAGFAIAFAAQADLARGAAPSPADREGSLARQLAGKVSRQLDRHRAERARTGRVSPLSDGSRAVLSRDLAAAETLLAKAGPRASLRDRNAVRRAAGRLHRLTDEKAAGPIRSLVGSGVISGTVTHAGTGDPIQFAYVEVVDCAGVYVTSTDTDALGFYTTDALLETGIYYVLAGAQAFRFELYDNVRYPPNEDVTSGVPVSVTSGATTGNIDFALNPFVGGAIAGTVTSAGGGAAIPTVVSIFDASGNAASFAFPDDATGAYTTTPLAPGTYYAYAEGMDGYLGELYDDAGSCPFFDSCTPTGGTPISVTAGSTTTGIDFGLSPGGRVSGTVLTSVGGAAVPALVSLTDPTGDVVEIVLTDGAGAYLTGQGLPNGNYYLHVEPFDPALLREIYDNIPCEPSCDPLTGTAVATTAGATTSGINFALDAGGGISGIVINGPMATPLVGASVLVYTSSGALIRSTATGDTGSYTVVGLPTGSYLVHAESSGNFVPQRHNNIPCVGCSKTTGTPVAVTAPATTGGIIFTMMPGGILTGRVTNVPGAAIGGLVVSAVTTSDVYTSRLGITSCTGDYQITGLTTANYKQDVRAEAGGHTARYRSELYEDVDCVNECSLDPAALVLVTQGSTTTGIDSELIRYTTVADFDASRTTDIGVYSPASGLWYIRNQFTLGYGGSGATIVPGDYDGDLYTDVAVYYEPSGLWYVRRSTTGTDLVQGFGGPGYTPAQGDYDGDGKVDFAVFHDASGIWFIRQSSDGATVSFGFGSSGATVVPADYDRDGKTDAAVYYEPSGLWYIRQSSSLTTFSVGYGTSGYKPVRGDFDGDGRWDIAVFHTGSGIWFLRNWTTGATTTVAFGAAGYIPVPGDYSGDARADLGVYDPASGLWFRRSVAGVTTTTTTGFGGPGYDPVVIK